MFVLQSWLTISNLKALWWDGRGLTSWTDTMSRLSFSLMPIWRWNSVTWTPIYLVLSAYCNKEVPSCFVSCMLLFVEHRKSGSNSKPSIIENIVSENLTFLDTSKSLKNIFMSCYPPKLQYVSASQNQSSRDKWLCLSTLTNAARENADINPSSEVSNNTSC